MTFLINFFYLDTAAQYNQISLLYSFNFSLIMAPENILQKKIMKRYFDILFSSAVLIFGIPLFLLLILLVRCSSKGPIFYGSTRIGKNFKQITCWKFRTMKVDAEEHLNKLLQENPELQKEWEQTYKLKHDVRITPIGYFLRKTSLDELPQFWNVLKGDLSVVGPRPVSREESDVYLSKKGIKMFSIRPGITGLWQTSGRNLLSYETRLDLDEYYVDHHNFLLDLRLISKTIPLIFFPKGAF